MSFFGKYRKFVRKANKALGIQKYHHKMSNSINKKLKLKHFKRDVLGLGTKGISSGCCGVGSSASDVYGATGSIVGRF